MQLVQYGSHLPHYQVLVTRLIVEESGDRARHGVAASCLSLVAATL